MQAIQSINVIAIDPNVRGGRPFILGTTIEVSAIVIATIVHGQTPEQIASEYKLTLTQVHATLAYYYEHKVEVDGLIEQRSQLADRLKEQMLEPASAFTWTKILVLNWLINCDCVA